MWTGRPKESEKSMSNKLLEWVLSRQDWPKLVKALVLWALEQANDWIDEEIAKRKAEADAEDAERRNIPAK